MARAARKKPPATGSFTVLFLPERQRVQVAGGTSILAAAAAEGLPLAGACGGQGTCGKCRVLVRPEEKGGARPGVFEPVLACQRAVRGNLVVNLVVAAVAVQRKSELNLLGAALPPGSDPGLHKICLSLPKPTLADPAPQRERLLAELARALPGPKGRPPPLLALGAMRALPQAMAQGAGRVTAVLAGNRVIAVETGDTTAATYGIAVDLGTTSIVATLMDLRARKALASATAANRQNGFGADVISRITHCATEKGGLQQLHSLAVLVINSLMDEVCARAGILPEQIHRMTLVGNPTMTHLFLGLNPASLAMAPFAPVTSRAVALEGCELGLHTAPHAQVHVLPAISGFVGADTVAMILATGLRKKGGVRLAIDVGTNGEIVLSAPGAMVACSTAAGPAFEGARIRHGIHASEGAIERVSVGREVRLKTIAGRPPLGICGSGLIDAVAGLVAAGVIAPSGRLCPPGEGGHLPPALRKRLGSGEAGNFFVLAPQQETAVEGPIVLTQRDIRELQLSKAAVRAGIEILMETLGIEARELDSVYLAGAFGNYIDRKSAMAIGLCPPVPLTRFEGVGNAAGVGAQMALLSETARAEADQISQTVRHVDLSTSPVFQQRFLGALNFPPPPHEQPTKGAGRHRKASA